MFGLKARDFSHLYYSSRLNPCPVCGRTDKKCRVKENGIHLMVWCFENYYGSRGDTTNLGEYTAYFAHPLEGMGSQWYLLANDNKVDIPHFKPSPKPKQTVNSLSLSEINQGFRELQKYFPLTPFHKQLLKTSRGLSDKQIERGGYFSLPTGNIKRERRTQLRVPATIPDNFPGLDENRMFSCYYASIIAPLFHPNGFMIGAQRWQPQSKAAKYIWLSSEENSKIQPYGELPLTFIKPQQHRRKAIALVEGTGFKPQIASDKLSQLVIGASGGLFTSSPKFFKEYLKTAELQGCDRRIEIFPDAGDILNAHVMYRWSRVIEFIQDLKYPVLVAYWEQDTKEKEDIDELEDLSSIYYISPSSFLKMAKMED